LKSAASAILLALMLGIPSAPLAALRHNSAADYVSMAWPSSASPSRPSSCCRFLGLLFGIYLHWLPVRRLEPDRYVICCCPHCPWAASLERDRPGWVRASMLELLSSPFIRTAFAKGLPLHTVDSASCHATRAAAVASFLVPAVESIMTGSLVVDPSRDCRHRRYNVPGCAEPRLHPGPRHGDHLFDLAIVMVLLVDLLYAWLDRE